MKKRMMTLLMNVTFNINFSSASATTLCKTKYQLHVQTCQKLVNSIVSVVLPLISELSIMTVHYGKRKQPIDESEQEEVHSSTAAHQVPVANANTPEVGPILSGKHCKCGSTTHQRMSHRERQHT